MGKDFWLNRWINQEIGWHQKEVEPALVEWAAHRKPARILVPLCGKSMDMIWLRDHGYEVVGVELSALACETFFQENKIEFTKTPSGEHILYQGGGILIINGDFFTVTREQVGKMGAVYDRAALIALPPKLRAKYSQKILELLGESVHQSDFGHLQVVLDRTPIDSEGPPYSVSPEEVKTLYGQVLDVQLLKRDAVEARGPVGSQTEECVLLLKPKN